MCMSTGLTDKILSTSFFQAEAEAAQQAALAAAQMIQQQQDCGPPRLAGIGSTLTKCHCTEGAVQLAANSPDSASP